MNLYWEDQNRLLFKFKKDQSEEAYLLPDLVKNINIKFELSKAADRSLSIIQQPFLISIKNFQFVANVILFSVDLSDLQDFEDLQIKVIRISIYYRDGQKEDILINKTFQLSEISYDDGELVEITEEEVIYERKRSYSVKKTTSKSQLSKKRKSKPPTSKIQKTQISSNLSNYSRSSSLQRLPISHSEYEKWLELKGDKSWETTLFMVREGYEKFKELEIEVKQLNSTIQKIALKNANAPQQPVYIQGPPQPYQSPSNLNPPGVKSPPKVNSKYSLSTQSADKVFRDKKDPKALNAQIAVMREMKEKFESVSDIRELLQTVSEQEISQERAKTDQIAFLEFKQKSLEKERQNKIKILKEMGFEEEVEKLTIEELENQIQILHAKEEKGCL